MKKEIKHNYNGCSNFYKYEFNSIHEFYDFITKTPTNKAFKGYSLSSKRHEYGYKWYGTEDWTECIDLLHNGWEDGSKKITQRLKDLSKMDLDTFRNSHIGIVFQSYNLLPHLTQNIFIPPILPGSILKLLAIIVKEKLYDNHKKI